MALPFKPPSVHGVQDPAAARAIQQHTRYLEDLELLIAHNFSNPPGGSGGLPTVIVPPASLPPHNFLDPTYHIGTQLSLPGRGEIVVGNSLGLFASVAIGAAGTYLGADGTDAAWTAGLALTKTDDTNVTLTLGGTPTTALLKAVSLTLGWTGQLSIARGGTGAATALAAFNALSPLTTLGDLLTRDASNNVRLAIGSSGQVLTVVAGAAAWASLPASTNALLDGSNHTDTVATTVVRGMLVVGNSTPKWGGLAIGTTGKFLRTNGTDPSWQTIAETDIADGALLGRLADNETITSSLGWTFINGVTLGDAGTSGQLDFVDASSGFINSMFTSALSSNVNTFIPAAGGNLITDTSTNTLTNKTMAVSTILIVNAASGVSGGARFRDTSTSTKQLFVVLSSATGSSNFDIRGSTATYLFPLVVASHSLNMVVSDNTAGKVDATAQGADIAATSLLAAGHTAGEYVVYVELTDTTADATAGTVTATIGYTDDGGARTSAVGPVALITANAHAAGAISFYSTGVAAITYTVAHTGIFGTSKYALRVRTVFLG